MCVTLKLRDTVPESTHFSLLNIHVRCCNRELYPAGIAIFQFCNVGSYGGLTRKRIYCQILKKPMGGLATQKLVGLPVIENNLVSAYADLVDLEF